MTAHLAVQAAAAKLPAGWAVESFRRLAAERGTRNATLAERSLSLSSSGLLYDRTEETDRQLASEQSARNAWVVLPGDLVVNPMWLFGGAIGVSDRRGAVSPDYRVYKLSPRLEPRFVHHLLRSSPYRDQYRLYMRAETTFDRRITKDDFKEMPLVVPPPQAQRAIADYLDAAAARIDALVVVSRRQQVLNAERVRSHVVRRMDRLIEAYGSIPLRRLVTCLDGRRIPLNAVQRASCQGPYPYYGASGIVDHVDRYLFDETLVLLGEDGAQLGDPIYPIARVVSGKVWVNNHAHVLRPHADPVFLTLRLNTFDRMSFISGSTREKITQEDMGRIPVPNVTREQQAQVARGLGDESVAMEKINSKLQRRVELLLERRQALVTAAVTGRLDIPGVAA